MALHYPRNQIKRPFRKPRKKPVTIIVGFICDDSIVLAADSQTSRGHSSKRIDTDKIHVIKFLNGVDVLVAQAGEAPITSRLIKLISENSPAIAVEKPRDVILCAENAVRALKKEMIEHMNPELYTLDEKDRFFKSNYDATLMIAFYYADSPMLFTLDFGGGLAEEEKIYATAGCGATVADYIIAGFVVDKMDFVMGEAVTIYIVEEVKKVDRYCDGPPTVARIFKNKNTNKFTPPLLDAKDVMDIVQELKIQDKAIKAQWANGLDSAMWAVTEKHFKEIMAASLDPTAPPLPSGQSPDAGPSTKP